MLKNDTSTLETRLIHALVDLASGSPVVFVGAASPLRARAAHHYDGPLEEVAAAILDVVRPSPATAVWGWLADPTDDEVYDLAFAIQGLAADAAREHLRMRLLDHDAFENGLPETALVVSVPNLHSGWAFAVFTA